MGAYEDGSHPWLAAEKRLIAEAVARGHALLGRLPRRAAARREPRRARRAGPAPEVGVLPVDLDRARRARDPVFARRPRSVRARCSGTATPTSCPPAPSGSPARRATSSRRSSFGRAYGLQFHLEVDAALAAEWMRGPRLRRQNCEQLDGPGAPGAHARRRSRAAEARVGAARARAVRALARCERRAASRPPRSAARALDRPRARCAAGGRSRRARCRPARACAGCRRASPPSGARPGARWGCPAGRSPATRPRSARPPRSAGTTSCGPR